MFKSGNVKIYVDTDSIDNSKFLSAMFCQSCFHFTALFLSRNIILSHVIIIIFTSRAFWKETFRTSQRGGIEYPTVFNAKSYDFFIPFTRSNNC